MTTAQVYELVGYIASLLVAISLTMSSVLKLRLINLAGAVFFTIYGLLIHAYPVAAVNFFIILINLFYLRQMLRTREFFQLLRVQPGSEYLERFLEHYQADIQKFQPGFAYQPRDNQLVFFILRNMVPAGLLIGEVRDGDQLYVRLDYAIPGYRDLKIGRFIYRQHTEDLRALGIRKIYTAPGAPAHARYLAQVGFEAELAPSGERLYCLTLE